MADKRKGLLRQIGDDLMIEGIPIADQAKIENKLIGTPGFVGAFLVIVCAILTGMAVKDTFSGSAFWAIFAVITGFIAFFLWLAVAVNWITNENQQRIVILARMIAAQSDNRRNPVDKRTGIG